MSHLIENVVKRGYLKKGGNSNRLSGLFRRNDGTKWFVFTIRASVPILEYYDQEVDSFTQQPINSFNLSTCQSISSMGMSVPHSFCIVCTERVLELVASSRGQMLDWVNDLEASLYRLGVLKREVTEHVYTVCPAVVRKPRPSKEVLEEREREAATATGTEMASDSSEVTPRPPPRERIPSGNLDVAESRLAPNVALPRTPPVISDEPPPLPQRPIPLASRNSVKRTTSDLPVRSDLAMSAESGGTDQEEGVARKTSESESDHVSGVSNDSDFVSWEEVMRLKNIFSNKNVDESTNTGDASESVSVEKDKNNSFGNQGYFDSERRGKAKASKPELKPKPSPKIMKRHNSPSSRTENLSSSSLSPSVNISSEMEKSFSAVASNDEEEEGEENVYSVPRSSPIKQDSNEDKDISAASSHCKPIPLPRKNVSKRYHVYDNNIPDSVNSSGASDDFYSENDSGETSVKVMALSESECRPSVENRRENLYVDVKHVSTETDSRHEHRNDLGGSSVSEGHSHPSHQTSLVEATKVSSKDENENFYGLMYDQCAPPTTMAPPIPPLPARHDSLGQKINPSINGRQEDSTQDHSSSTGNASSQPEDHSEGSEVTPPLPLPRKKGGSSMRSSLPASAFSEIPPMLPRRPPPKRDQSQEDKPPALPVRNAQSFFIKRPQLTGFLNSNDGFEASSSDPQGKMKAQASSIEDTSDQGAHSGAVGGSSRGGGLSQKMLLERAHSLHTVVSLKQTQVEILQSEIGMTSISVSLTQKSGHGLALVEWNKLACIVGWNQKDYPSLHAKLHIGDLIYSINNIKVTSPETAQKLLKNATSSKIEVILHRMPYAKVFAIRREVEGQNLGIRREKGTAEIVYIDPNGLAAQHGLPPHGTSAFDSSSRSNWFLTEINSRPLNLFFKENEIDHRLSAVGREISVVVQPSDFIFEIRRQFKKLKNYKNYIVQ